MQFSLITLCLVLAIFSLLVVAGFVAFTPDGRRQSNFLLATFFLSIALILSNFLFVASGLVMAKPRLAYLGNTIGISAAPILFLYARSLTDQRFVLNALRILHLAPIAFFVAIIFFGYTSLPIDDQLNILRHGDYPNIVNTPLLPIGIYIVVFTYLTATIVTVRKYRVGRREFFTTKGADDLTWLTSLIWGMLLLWSLSLFHQIVVTVWPIRWLDQLFLNVMAIGAFGLGLYLLINALKQAKITPLHVPVEIYEEQKYGNDRLSVEQLEQFAGHIETEMQNSDAFLKPSLTLSQFVESLPMTERELSQTLNRHYGQSFFDFINKHRISFAKEKLLADETGAITDAMLSSGFSSKSSFYSAFRKETGVTPSEFRNQHTASLVP